MEKKIKIKRSTSRYVGNSLAPINISVRRLSGRRAKLYQRTVLTAFFDQTANSILGRAFGGIRYIYFNRLAYTWPSSFDSDDACPSSYDQKVLWFFIYFFSKTREVFWRPQKWTSYSQYISKYPEPKCIKTDRTLGFSWKCMVPYKWFFIYRWCNLYGYAILTDISKYEY